MTNHSELHNGSSAQTVLIVKGLDKIKPPKPLGERKKAVLRQVTKNSIVLKYIDNSYDNKTIIGADGNPWKYVCGSIGHVRGSTFCVACSINRSK